MRRFITVIVAVLLSGNIYAQELPVIQVKAQHMIIDKNPLRYIPLNIISNNDAEVFAANASAIDFKLSVLAIQLAEATEIDSVTFKAGYFDARFYKQNDRIKKIKLEFRIADGPYSSTVSLGSEEFTLTDEMKAQTFKLKKKYKCAEIAFSVLELFKGDKWDDLVITNISFSNDDKVLTPVIKPNGSHVAYYESNKYYQYNEKNQLIRENSSYGKAGGDNVEYIYQGDRLAVKLYSWDAYDTERTLMLYKEHETGNIPFGEETFDYSGKSIKKKAFTYSGNNLAEENIDGGKKIIKYTYSGNNLISEECFEEGKSIYVKTYSYENGICIAEYSDYKTAKGLFRKWLYKYFYENGKLKTELLVYHDEGGNNKYLTNGFPCVYDYVYQNGNLAEKKGGDAW